MEHYRDFPINLILSVGSIPLGFVVNQNFLAAIVLPILFFVIGKTIDVMVKIYLEKRKK